MTLPRATHAQARAIAHIARSEMLVSQTPQGDLVYVTTTRNKYRITPVGVRQRKTATGEWEIITPAGRAGIVR